MLAQTLAWLQTLIGFPSVSATSNVEVSQWVQLQLQSLGFQCESIDYADRFGVAKRNIVACRNPLQGVGSSGGESSGAGLAYFAHTDVVPAVAWEGPGGRGPFEATPHGTRLYGRGSCDMKGSLACFLSAVASMDVRAQRAPLWIICTADEEVGFAGARQVVARSGLYAELRRRQPPGIIGEPTGLEVVHAHKGITGLEFISRGRAAHSSTRLGLNANLAIVPLLVRLREIHERCEQDARLQDADFDPPTLGWNFGVSDGATAHNITPQLSRVWVTLRPMVDCDGKGLVDELRELGQSLGLEVTEIAGCGPLWVEPDRPFVQNMVALAGVQKAKTVSYATDGGIFGGLEERVILGPGDIRQAHTADEFIELSQLEAGAALYRRAIETFCYAP
jgi:acetylornithine deacetylase